MIPYETHGPTAPPADVLTNRHFAAAAPKSAYRRTYQSERVITDGNLRDKFIDGLPPAAFVGTFPLRARPDAP